MDRARFLHGRFQAKNSASKNVQTTSDSIEIFITPKTKRNAIIYAGKLIKSSRLHCYDKDLAKSLGKRNILNKQHATFMEDDATAVAFELLSNSVIKLFDLCRCFGRQHLFVIHFR